MTELYITLILEGGFFFLILGIMWARGFKRIWSYQTGQCRIVAKQLHEGVWVTTSQMASGGGFTRGTIMYRPEFKGIVYTSDNLEYQAKVYYDAFRFTSPSPGKSQATVDQYTVGEIYPCWYDPDDPTEAMLTRKIGRADRIGFSVIFVIGCLSIIVGVCLLLF